MMAAPRSETMRSGVYRRWVGGAGLNRYAVREAQSDLLICTQGDFTAQACEALHDARRMVEEAIAALPLFARSLIPLPEQTEAAIPELHTPVVRATRRAGTGPMAAVAGAIAQHVGMVLAECSEEVLVENGGDVYLRSARPQRIRVLAESTVLHGLDMEIRPEEFPACRTGVGLCTSSGRPGPSLSFGKADAVTVLAEDAALADALATAMGNRVKGVHDVKPALETAARLGAKRREQTTLDDMPFARYYTSRNAFQNYMGFTNVKNAPSYAGNPASIFACRPIPPLAGLAVSGSGEINPSENDPDRRVLRPGIRVLVNGTEGILVGYGTRASSEQACFATVADMKGMDPQYMGGFRTSYGVEVTNSLAVPFPVTDQRILDRIMACRDENVFHKIGDLADRLKIVQVRYAEIWKNAPLEVSFDPERCVACSFQCAAEYYCPMNAISWKDKTIDQTLCVACGACTANCLGGAFMGKDRAPARGLRNLHIFDQDVPIIFRQSNRLRGERLATLLKDRLLSGRFYLADSNRCARFY